MISCCHTKIAMDSSIIYSCFLLLLFLYFLTKHFIKADKTLPPSPGVSLPVIGHLHLLKRPLHRTIAKLSAQHGPVLFIRFGSRPVVVVSSPSALEECFTKNDITFANRPRLLAGKHLGYNYTTLPWAPYGDHWRNLRRISSLEILSSGRLQMFQAIRVDEVRLLCTRLFRGSKGAEYLTVDMKGMFFEMVLNVLMRMIGGKRYYGEGVSGLEEEARRFKEIVAETFQSSGADNLVDFLPFLKWPGLSKVEQRLSVMGEKRGKFMQDLIEEHRRMRSDSVSEEQRSTESRTTIDALLSLQETEPEYYTDEIIRGLMQVMLSAGTDTTAETMEWALSNLLNNPEALVEARSEIDTKIGKTRVVEESDVSKLQYLDGIIKETLRMYPAAPLLVPHESSEDCTVGGFKVPRGTMLLVNLWGMQNDPTLWEEPSKFKPERFIQENESDNQKYRLLPFGSGRRGCPGESLAMKILGLGLGTLIQCFEWKRVGDEMVDMSEGTGLTMPRAKPLIAMCKPRSAMVTLLSQL